MAAREPRRPTMEHTPNRELRSCVGKISAVNEYRAQNDTVMANLANMNKVVDTHVSSARKENKI